MDEIVNQSNREKAVDIEEEKVKLVIFTLFNDWFAFYGDDVKEVLPIRDISYVPGAPDLILGIINVRGDVESVLNIHRLLGLPDAKITEKSLIAIAENSGVRSGILVDSIEEVVDIPKSLIKPPISTLDESIKGFVIGEALYMKRHVTLLDIGKIFATIR